MKLICALVAILLFCVSGFAQLPTWRDSYSGVHSFYAFLPMSNAGLGAPFPGHPGAFYYTDQQLIDNAWKFDIGWSPRAGGQVKAANPAFTTVNYTDGTQSSFSLTYYQTNLPECILYQADQVTPLRAYSYFAVIPDFTNSTCRGLKWNTDLAPVAAVSVAMGIDNSLLSNDFCGNGNGCGTYLHAKGNYPNAVPGNIMAAPFNNKFAGVGNENDPAYTSAFITYLAYIQSQLHSYSPPRLFMPNTTPQIVFNNPSLRTQFINAVDGVLIEGGLFGPEWAGDPRKFWLGNVKFIQDMNALGKGVYSMTAAAKFANEAALTGTTVGKQWIRFALASYLLAKGHAAGLTIFAAGDNDSAWNIWPAEWDAAHSGAGVSGATGIGTPCSNFIQVGGVAGSENGLFVREYTGGVVVINASATIPSLGLTGSSFGYTLPSIAGVTYADLYGNSQSASVTLGPIVYNSSDVITESHGEVFLKVTSGSAPVCSSGTGGGPDVTGPFISGISSGTPTDIGATITYSTDEASDTQIEYGLTASTRSSLTTLDSSLVTSHSQSIPSSGTLAASTTYHYAVRSRDASGNLSVSGDSTFTTAASTGFIVTTSSLPNGTQGASYTGGQLASSGGSTGGANGYSYYLVLTQDHTKVPSSGTYTFPVCKTNSALRSVANGGHVANSMGYDIALFTSTSPTTKIPHRMEYYDATTGQWCADVRYALSSSVDTLLYLFYGNGSISASQEDTVANVWPSSYAMVWNGANLTDSSQNPANFTASASPPTYTASGILGPDYTFAGAALTHQNLTANASKLNITGNFTAWGYVKTSSANAGGGPMVSATGPSADSWYMMFDYANDGKIICDLVVGGAQKIARSVSTYNNNVVHRVECGFNGSNAILDIDNGAEHITGTATTGPLDSAGGYIRLGDFYYNGVPSLQAEMDRVRIINAVITTADRTVDYNSNTQSTFITVGTEQTAPGTGGITWAVVSGSLPTGLSLSSSGLISGMPSSNGVSSFSVRATDATAAVTPDKALSITIGVSLDITPPTLTSGGLVGQGYIERVFCSGGVAPYSINYLSGNLPPGVTVDTSGGVNVGRIGGVLMAAGSFTFSVQCDDSAGASATKAYTIGVDQFTGTTVSQALSVTWDSANFDTTKKVSIEYSLNTGPWITGAWVNGTASPYNYSTFPSHASMRLRVCQLGSCITSGSFAAYGNYLQGMSP